MSILIKGMDVPDRCFACPLCVGEDDDWSCAISHGPYIEYRAIATDIAIDTRPDWCPLVPVPSHGRLIDADAMCDGLVLNNPVVIYAECMPTIIPAEEDE